MDPAKSILTEITYRILGSSETPAADAVALLARIFERSTAWVLAHPEAVPDAAQRLRLDSALERLERGEPLPYVLGEWEFYGLKLGLSPEALIPRPETELLVEQALAWLRSRPEPVRAADVGTGSGAIAIALAANDPQIVVVAADLSAGALRTAAANVARHSLASRVWCVQADLLPPGNNRFDLICANLPYIPTADLSDLRVARWEPISALDGGPDGLDVVRRLLAQAPGRLAPGGAVLLEIESGQGRAAVRLARKAFPGAQVRLMQDLAGWDRLVFIQSGP